MKVLFVGNGQSNFLVDTASQLSSKDCTVDLLSFKKKNSTYFRKTYVIGETGTYKIKLLDKGIFFASYVLKLVWLYRKYDVIHFHMFYWGSAFVLPFVSSRVKTIQTLWGSDINRASKLQITLARFAINRVDLVTVTSISFASKVYSILNRDPYVVPYPVVTLDSLVEKKIRIFDRDEKIRRIIVGTNSNPKQRHLEIISILSAGVKNKQDYLLEVPFTYGRGSHEYEIKLRKALVNSGFQFLILKDFVERSELWKRRIGAFCLIQVQEYDQLSATVIEYLAAGTNVICGDWLLYTDLERLGCEFHKISSLQEIPSVINQLTYSDKDVLKTLHNNYSLIATQEKWKALYNTR